MPPRYIFAPRLCTVVFFLVALTTSALSEAERQVVVAADGTGAFKTVTAALESIKDANKREPRHGSHQDRHLRGDDNGPELG